VRIGIWSGGEEGDSKVAVWTRQDSAGLGKALDTCTILSALTRHSKVYARDVIVVV